MINLFLIILFLLLGHWYADFILQTKNQKANKSISNKHLFYHSLSYGFSIFILVFILDLFDLFGAQYEYTIYLFALIQFISHFVIDYCTSRMTKKLWTQKDINTFFIVIGFDQFLHYVILFGSLFILFY